MLKSLLNSCNFFPTNEVVTSPVLPKTLLDIIESQEPNAFFFLSHILKFDRSGLADILQLYGKIPLKDYGFDLLYFCICNFDKKSAEPKSFFQSLEPNTRIELIKYLALETISRVTTYSGYANRQDYIHDLTNLAKKAEKLYVIFPIIELESLKNTCTEKIAAEMDSNTLSAPKCI